MAADLDPVADELYALPRDEFTAARNAAAKRARQSGDKKLAEQIQALRRPSTAAWLANLLSREHPDEVKALVNLGDGLRAAQDQLEGEALRRLSQQRHEVVHGLVEQARALARSAGNPASDAVTRELEDTFTAAVNSSAAAEAVAGGRLTSALDPAEAGGLLGTTTTPRRRGRTVTSARTGRSGCAATSNRRVPRPRTPTPPTTRRSASSPTPNAPRTTRPGRCASCAAASRTRRRPSTTRAREPAPP
ncbi:MAG TPA: hypothetical protein VGN22_18080, partial [Pseudonocardia sp.]